MNQEELLKSLMELDFIAVDLGLFLNTHPDDNDAIAAYNQVITAADTVRMKYEETFGPLAPSAAMPPIHRLGSGWKIHGLGRTMPIFLWQERSVNKCGFMKRNWNFL